MAVSYENIDDTYAYGKYDNFTVIIMRVNEKTNVYYVGCGQSTYMKRLKREKKETHTVINAVPNSIYLFDHIKKYLDIRVKVSGRNITLYSIDEYRFVDEVKSLFDGRREIDLTVKPK